MGAGGGGGSAVTTLLLAPARPATGGISACHVLKEVSLSVNIYPSLSSQTYFSGNVEKRLGKT